MAVDVREIPGEPASISRSLLLLDNAGDKSWSIGLFGDGFNGTVVAVDVREIPEEPASTSRFPAAVAVVFLPKSITGKSFKGSALL